MSKNNPCHRSIGSFRPKVACKWFVWNRLPILIPNTLIKSMNLILKAALPASLILCVSAAAHAQRMGYSIGLPSTSSGGPAQPSHAHAPALPSLPGPLPSFSTNSVQVQLEKLNLRSMHMVPPRLNLFANPGRSGILQQVPFALDKILEKPGMCVE
jgi:hypothetical protein